MLKARKREIQSAINVTPLVDVVLELLIIFMMLAPRLTSAPLLELPATERPPQQPDDGRQILVTIERDGTLWVDGEPVTREHFPVRVREAAQGDADRQVVIEGDARLSFGEVQQAMLAVEAAGFADVSLVAEREEQTRWGG